MLIFHICCLELQLYKTIPKMYTKDVRLFEQDSGWYAVHLEGTEKGGYGQQIVVKEYQVSFFYSSNKD